MFVHWEPTGRDLDNPAEWWDVWPVTSHRTVKKRREAGNLLRMTKEESEAIQRQNQAIKEQPTGQPCRLTKTMLAAMSRRLL